jgi:hypothetical protein
MKKILVFMTFLTFFFHSAYAQSQTDTSRVFNCHSLQFRVYHNLSLESFKGGLLSYKYHLNDQNAIRVGVSLSARKWDEEESRENITPDTTFLKQERDHSSSDIEVIAEYLRYFNPKNKIKLFMGVGTRFSLLLDKFTTENIDTLGTGATYYENRRYEYNQYGLNLSVGIEWLFLSYMSLHAEYGAHFSYFTFERYSKYVNLTPPGQPASYRENLDKGNGFEISDRGVLFGLSVYF